MTVGGTDFHIQEWQLTLTSRLAEVTNSGSSGVARWQEVLTEGQGSFNFCWDSEQIPDVDVSLAEGDAPVLRLYCGDSTKFYTFTAVVESVQTTNNALSDVVKGTVNFRVNGAITRPVT